MAVYYPPAGFHFSVEFELEGLGDKDSRFQEINGLNQDISTDELNEGGENRYSYHLPNRISVANLVLKRGYLIDSGLIDWIKNAVENFRFKPANLTVKLLDEETNPLSSWYVVNAYPVKWNLSGFNAEQNSLAIETIELKYQYFKII